MGICRPDLPTCIYKNSKKSHEKLTGFNIYEKICNLIYFPMRLISLLSPVALLVSIFLLMKITFSISYIADQTLIYLPPTFGSLDLNREASPQRRTTVSRRMLRPRQANAMPPPLANRPRNWSVFPSPPPPDQHLPPVGSPH